MKPTRIAVAVLSVSLLVQTAIFVRPLGSQEGRSTESPLIWHALWELHPRTISEARGYSVAVVLARVSAVQQAPDIVTPLPGTPDGEDREPNQRISLDVIRTLAGNSNSTIKLYHIGSDKMWIHDDPPYRVGEAYVLFLREKIDEPGTHLLISPEGRYRVGDQGLEPVAETDSWATAMRGKSVTDLERALAAAQ